MSHLFKTSHKQEEATYDGIYKIKFEKGPVALLTYSTTFSSFFLSNELGMRESYDVVNAVLRHEEEEEEEGGEDEEKEENK